MAKTAKGAAPVRESFDDNVTVSLKPVQPLHIEIDIDRLTVADLDFVSLMAQDKANTKDLVRFFGRVLPDADINAIPLRAIPKIADAIMRAIGGASDPNG